MQSFADLGVSSAVVKALASEGVQEPFAVQRLVISDILAGRDVLARSPTGSGKTLAFGIPLVDRIASDGRRPAALILAPTRELATQIAADIRGIAHARALRGHRRLRRRRPGQAGQGSCSVPDPGGNARTPGGPAGPSSLHAGPHHDARPRRGRPHARHGLSARGGPDRARVPGTAPDAVLLGHAGRRGRRHGDALHHRPRPSRGRAFGAPRRRRGGAPVRPGVRRGAHRSAHRRAGGRTRPGARVRAHQARRRPPGQAPGRPRRPRDGDARQQVPAPARGRAGPL